MAIPMGDGDGPMNALFRRAPLLLLLASTATLGAALVSQYGFGLQPCILCIYQRWPFVAVILLAAVALILPPRSAGRAVLLAASGVALWIGAGIALYHVGVEQHWWIGTPACVGTPAPVHGTDITALRDQLLATRPVRCDEVTWSLFGISMAGYNAVLSVALGAASLYAAARLIRERRA